MPNKPAFAFYDEGDLWISSFQSVGSDHIYRIKNFDEKMKNCKDGNDDHDHEVDPDVEMIYERTFPWPNSIQRVPDSIMQVLCL